MSGLRKLIVTGATGKQGGALISALLEKPNQPFDIYAVSRDPSSKSSQTLARKGVNVIKGDFDSAEEIMKQVEKPWGLFSVTMPMGGAKKEEAQGKAMTQAALAAGVQHIVFTATERGGQEKSETDPTPIPHFISKYNIEKDIAEKSETAGTTWTFLRPVAFFENLTPGFLGKAFTTVWRLNGMDNKVQFISTMDIGKVAADAFMKYDSAEYRNQGISLAGDELDPQQMADVFKQHTGEEIPTTYPFIARIIRWLLWEQLGIMFQWFADVGFKTDVQAVKKRYPFMKGFKEWLETESAWAKKSV
jgi:uncharacterized protein YbjT (DUF2867 family)